MYWKTKDGRKLLIADMETDHIRNSIAMLQRQGYVGADEFWSCVGAASSMQGEMASYYAEQGVADMKISQAIDVMAYELERRANAKLPGSEAVRAE